MLTGRTRRNQTKLGVVYVGSMTRICTLILVLLLGTCKHPVGSTNDDWTRWFDATTALLPKWDVPAGVGGDSTVTRTRDGLAVRLGSDFHKRNDFCWDNGMDHFPRPAWRDICVGRLQPELELRPGFHLVPRSLDPRMTDQYESEGWQAGTVSFGGRPAIVERARVSGGMEFARKERRTSVLLEVGKGEWARLDGRTSDDSGYSEILEVAGTVEVP